MNGISLVGGPLAQAIGWAVVHLLWQGTLIAAILAALLALMENRSAGARYLVSCAALFALLCGGIVTGYRSYETPSMGTRPTAATALAASDSDGASTSPGEQALKPAPVSRMFTILAMIREYLPAIVLLWLAGVTLLSVRLVWSWIGARRMVRRGLLEAEGGLQRTAARLAKSLGLRRAVHLVESATVEVPTVVGFLRPVILLPLSTLSGLSFEQVEMILAHVLAHVRRHDFLVNLLQAVVETLLFYHPAVWWMSRRIRIERENCCDDLAVGVCGNALQYARALARLEELRADGIQAVVAANGGSLIARIRRIVGSGASHRTSSTSRWVAGAAVLTTVILLLAIPSVPLLAQREISAATPAKDPTPAPGSATSEIDVPAPTPDGDADVDGNNVPSDADQANSFRDAAEAAVRSSARVSRRAMAIAAHAVDMAGLADDMMPLPAMAPIAATEPTPAVEASPSPAPVAVVAPTPSPSATPAPPAPPAGWPHVATPRLPRQVVAPLVPFMFRGHGARRHIGSEGKLSVDDLITLRTLDVTPEYVQQMRDVSGKLSFDDIVAMRVQGITPDYVREMHSLAFDDLVTEDLLGMRTQQVTSAYVKQMRAAGIELRKAHDAMTLKVVGVTPEFVKSLHDAGYANLSARDLVRLKTSGVNSDFIREMSKYHSSK